MGRPSYLIAKYVADLFRNEPVNIGVIVWSDGEAVSKFIGEQDGKIQGSALPGDLKKGLASYRQWFQSWKRIIERGRVLKSGTNDFILKADARFLEALQRTGEANYILEKGGELLEDVPSSDLCGVVDYLFGRLVTHPGASVEPSKTAELVRDELLKDAHVNVLTTTQVKLDQKLKVKFGNKFVHHEFHLCIGNGTPIWLGHVVPLTSQPKEVKKTADSAAWRFSGVSSDYGIQRDHCVAIVYATEQREEDLIQDSLTELEYVARIEYLDSTRPKLINEIRAMVDIVKSEQH